MKINLSKIGAYFIVALAWTISSLIVIYIVIKTLTMLMKVNFIYAALNQSGGFALGLFMAIILAFVFVPLLIFIKSKIIDIILSIAEKKPMKEKRA